MSKPGHLIRKCYLPQSKMLPSTVENVTFHSRKCYLPQSKMLPSTVENVTFHSRKCYLPQSKMFTREISIFFQIVNSKWIIKWALLSPEGTFAGRNFRRKELSPEGTFAGRNFRRKELSPEGTFAGRNFRRKELSPEGTFAGRNFRRKELSPEGTFAGRNFRGFLPFSRNFFPENYLFILHIFLRGRGGGGGFL